MITRIFALAQFVLLFATAGAQAQQSGPRQLEFILPTAPGVAEIEQGRIDAGIRRLEKAWDVPHLKEPVSISLCAAYTLKRDFEQAEVFCDQAVRSNPLIGGSWTGSNSDAAFNNRGVLRALQGDFEGAVSDFRQASERTDKGYLRKPTFARREKLNGNLELAEQMLAEVREAQQERQVADTRN